MNALSESEFDITGSVFTANVSQELSFAFPFAESMNWALEEVVMWQWVGSPLPPQNKKQTPEKYTKPKTFFKGTLQNWFCYKTFACSVST